MGRFVPIAYTTNIVEKTAPKVTGAKTYYDGKQCWQYKVIYDRPGTYTFTVPSNAICARTVIVGGGGKPVCNNACCGVGGAGGGYSEKCHAITPGTTSFTIVVGRQGQDSTVACNAVAVHTAGGAVGCAPGVASGGDWNSRGGCAGLVCNYCGGSVSQGVACICITTGTCCGYCLVFAYNENDHGNQNGCYVPGYAGGASAGSPRHLCGGCSACICNSGDINHGATGTGGGGIGSQCPLQGNVWHYSCCDCVCFPWDGNGGGYCGFLEPGPTSAGGGGGSHSGQPSMCRSWSGTCMCHNWAGGTGGYGGFDIPPTDPLPNAWTFTCMNRCNESYGGDCGQGWVCLQPKRCDPMRKPWWDICDISGAGAPGHVHENGCIWCCAGTQWSGLWGRPSNAGEGAGTGATVFRCCNANQYGDKWYMMPNSPADAVNWLLVCCLGAQSDPFRCDSAYILKDKLFSGFVTCAGTLGGSGGTGICYYTSKAGFGGGGGMAKCHIVCVCYGGTYNNCNGGATPLAFPPCILDNLVSNAGSGLAIVYYKEA